MEPEVGRGEGERMSGEKVMGRCEWRLQNGDPCAAMYVTDGVPGGHVMPAGWTEVRCEDGEYRTFCPGHAYMLRRPEEDGPQ